MKTKYSYCKLALGFMLTAFSAHAFSNEIEIGRVKMTFPSSSWKAVSVEDKGIDYTGGQSGTLKSEIKIIVNEHADGTPNAIAIVRSTSGGLSTGFMKYSADCPSQNTLFSDGNNGHSRSFMQCLLVYGFYYPHDMLTNRPVDQTEFLKKHTEKWLGGARPLIATYANSTGTHLHVEVWLSPAALGIRHGFESYKQDTKAEQSISWGKQLMESVKGSVMSISGRMAFPSLEVMQTVNNK
jgi:hypothetical protein